MSMLFQKDKSNHIYNKINTFVHEMFNGLAREINMILGRDYSIAFDFYPRQDYSAETMAQYKNVGTLYNADRKSVV